MRPVYFIPSFFLLTAHEGRSEGSITAALALSVSGVILLPAAELIGRRFMGSSGAATAATMGRGNRNTEDNEYQFILPQLPKGKLVINTVFLHGDVRARPYKVEDFRDALTETGLLPDVVSLGAYQINHLWAVTFNDAAPTKRLLALKELKVKGRRCVVVDPQDQQVKLRLHWLLHGVSDEDVRVAFAAYGKVVEVSRERWRVPGMADKCSTTRTVLLKLKSGLKVEDLPHQIRVDGELALVVVPGRPMQCLRCQGTGHVRRECKVPRCSRCRRFGHVETDCVRTYASATATAKSEGVAEHVMDAAETEDAAQGAGSSVVLAAAEGSASAEAHKVREEPQHLTAPVITPSVAEPEQAAMKVVPVDTDEAAATQGEASGSGDEMSVTSATLKRSHEKTTEVEKTSSTSNEEPPSKTPQGRRSTLRPTPNFSNDKRPGRKAKEKNAGEQDGPGGG